MIKLNAHGLLTPRTSYQNGFKLTGIIYLHRITDIRVSGMSRRTFGVFRKLCGKTSLSNVLIVTNMWDDPPSAAQLDRETELREHPDFFQPALDQGATMVRRTHMNSKSAHDIIRILLNKEPTIMQVQHELVNEKKQLSDTGAGREVQRELIEATERHNAEMKTLKSDMEEALRERDEQTQKDLADWQKQAEAVEKQRQADLESLKKGFNEEQVRWRKQVEDARAEREAAMARQQAIRDELEEARRRQQEASDHHRQELQEKVAELEKRIAAKPDCIIA